MLSCTQLIFPKREQLFLTRALQFSKFSTQTRRYGPMAGGKPAGNLRAAPRLLWPPKAVVFKRYINFNRELSGCKQEEAALLPPAGWDSPSEADLETSGRTVLPRYPAGQ